MIDVSEIKKDFPIFRDNDDFVYLDSTATSLKPSSVIHALSDYYSHYSANIFRGVYDISERSTKEYEETRTIVKDFIHATRETEIIFTRNTTESINLFVNGISEGLQKGDEIVTVISEHHSNFVPWQQMAQKKELTFTIIDVDETGTWQKDWRSLISKKTKILALAHVSNVLGTLNPIQSIIKEAKEINPNIIILVDGAQAVGSVPIDVQALGCDAFVFSAHKMLGPTGVGVLWTKEALLKTFPPYQFGGEMIRSVSVKSTVFADLPHRFEAGTPHIAGVIAFKQAILYLQSKGLKSIYDHEVALAQDFYDKLNTTFGKDVTIIGPPQRASGIVAFTLNGVHAHDVAQILNEDNIAVRAGHHCAMPLHNRLGIEASVRASFYLYNSFDDVDTIVRSLKKVQKTFHR